MFSKYCTGKTPSPCNPCACTGIVLGTSLLVLFSWENPWLHVLLKTLYTHYLFLDRGHGTYAEDGKLLASVAGVVETVNLLIYVKPLKSRSFLLTIADDKALTSFGTL